MSWEEEWGKKLALALGGPLILSLALIWLPLFRDGKCRREMDAVSSLWWWKPLESTSIINKQLMWQSRSDALAISTLQRRQHCHEIQGALLRFAMQELPPGREWHAAFCFSTCAPISCWVELLLMWKGK